MRVSNTRRLALLAAATVLPLARFADAGTDVWTGTDSPGNVNWSDPNNWNALIPNTSTNAHFGGTTNLNSNIDTAQAIASLVFDPSAGAYTLSGSALTLSAASAPSINDTAAATETINAPIALSSARTINVTAGKLILAGGLSNASNSGLIVYGTSAGTVDVTNPVSITTSFTVNAGTLLDDMSTSASSSNFFVSTNTVALDGGTLSLAGDAAAAGTNSQALGALTTGSSSNAQAGASAVVVTNTGGGSALLTFASRTRNAASTLDVTLPTGTQSATNGVIFTTAGSVVNSVMVNGSTGSVAYATVNGGSTWASLTGTNVVGLATYATGTNANYTGNNLNIDVANNAPTGTSTGVNTLRFNSASDTLDLSQLTGPLLVRTGGVLITPSGAGSSISGGTIQSNGASSPELVVIDYSSVNISSTIANSTNGGSVVTALTLSGPGTTTLSGSNTYTGQTYINQGATSIAAPSALSAAQVNLNAGTLQVTANLALPNNIFLANAGGGLAATGTNTLTVNGTVSAGNAFGTLAFNTGATGTIVLPNANTYLSANSINGGVVLANNSSGSATGTGPVIVNAATLGGTGIISGAVTTSTNSHLAAGGVGTIGTLTFSSTGGLIIGSNANLDFDLSSASTTAGTGTNDLLALTGSGATLLLSSNDTVNFNFPSNGGPVLGQEYTLVTYSALAAGSAPVTSLIAAGTDGNTATFSDTGTALQVEFTAPIPEPASIGLVALVGSATLLRRRRSRPAL